MLAESRGPKLRIFSEQSVDVPQIECLISAYRRNVRSALFWDLTEPRMAVPCRRFVTTYRFHPQGSNSPREVKGCMTIQDETDRLFPVVSAELPFHAA